MAIYTFQKLLNMQNKKIQQKTFLSLRRGWRRLFRYTSQNFYFDNSPKVDKSEKIKDFNAIGRFQISFAARLEA